MNVTAVKKQATAAQVAGVVVGVDTHQLTHHAAVMDLQGRRLGDREFPASATGHHDLWQWAQQYGPLDRVGVESTGSYGAGLTRYLLVLDAQVYEVNRPEKSTRVTQGKSDPIDAYSAAEQVRTSRVVARPKIKTGIVESLRVLKIPRDVAVKDRTRAYSQLRDLITTAPAVIRDELIVLSARQRTRKAAAMRPDAQRLHEPLYATKYALRQVAERIQALDAEIAAADNHITTLTKKACPTLLAMPQIGPQTAARMVITAGENIERMRSEAAFAKLTGVAPLPASSGKNTTRHRLNRGGDRQANSALYMVVVGRMKNHPETLAYLTRRTAQGHTKPEIIRCLKRHLARSIYKALRTDLMTP